MDERDSTIPDHRNTVNPFLYHYQNACSSLFRAKLPNENEPLESMACILFLAFCLESYLNLIGQLYIHKWKEEFERRLGTEAKLLFLTLEKRKISRTADAKNPVSFFEISPPEKKKLATIIDFGKFPFDSFRNIMGFRNTLVHGKTESEKSSNHPDDALVVWQQECTSEIAEKHIRATGGMLEFLHDYFFDTGNPLNVHYQLERFSGAIRIKSLTDKMRAAFI